MTITTPLDAPGHGAASAARARTMSLFGASHIPRLGDIVLAATTTLDTLHGTPERLELRAFRANAHDRAALATVDDQRLRTSDGFIALLQVDLHTDVTPFPIDRASDRIARLRLCMLSAELEAAGDVTRDRVLQWLLATVVVHLNLGSYVALTGDARAFPGNAASTTKVDKRSYVDRVGESDFGRWGRPWLHGAGAHVSDLEPGTFTLDLAASHAAREQVATAAAGKGPHA